MPANKSAFIRYKTLDRCFSDYSRKYFIEDLHHACTKALDDGTFNKGGITERQIREDIRFMQSEAGFAIELSDNCFVGRKKYYQYSNKHYSIFKKNISDHSLSLIKELVVMLQSIEGVFDYKILEEIFTAVDGTIEYPKQSQQIVFFDQNPDLKGIDEWFVKIYNHIKQKEVIKITYKPFNKTEVEYHITHPYFLKQYQNRWFLFGNTDLPNDKLRNLALDRIISITVLPKIQYIESKENDYADYLYDIIGVTYYDKEVEEVELIADNHTIGYITTKPLHPSQRVNKLEENKYSIKLNVIHNYELEAILMTFADRIEIVKPQTLRNAILERSKNIIDKNR